MTSTDYVRTEVTFSVLHRDFKYTLFVYRFTREVMFSFHIFIKYCFVLFITQTKLLLI
jgi:hypothetical protein